MTGRASGLGNSFFSAPPPLASEDMDPFTNSAPKFRLDRLSENPSMKWTMDQQHGRLKAQRTLTSTMDATNELYFFCLADLINISHTASTRVYSSDALKQGSNEIESRIDFYNSITVDWRSSLPDSLRFEVLNSGLNLSTEDAYRISLAMHYHSSRIILNRPCLTRKKEGKSDVKNHISRARADIEMTCLHSALEILSIFPDDPSVVWLRCVPWWNVLHFLVQATTILLINLSFDSSLQRQRSQRVNSDSNNGRIRNSAELVNPEALLTAAEKALLWFCLLGETDDSARRAFELCSSCIRRIESRRLGQDSLGSANDASMNDASMNDASEAAHLDGSTDQTYQQHQSRPGVSHSQLAGTRGFGYDQKVDAAAAPSESGDTEDFEFVGPSIGTLGTDIDMSDYLPDPENATLDEILQFLA
ncbi:uncharacterized protein PFLUO_LOCUS2691 [Penicillium psychrofluorescens]|uniref:uncharacterized protein n=1 Tax=Penicillium psychrofluorescens TaxID=3158075 RepID=UPI003CCE45C8